MTQQTKDPIDQANDLVLWIGDKTPGLAGNYVKIRNEGLPASEKRNKAFLLDHLKDAGLIEMLQTANAPEVTARLTVRGWERFNELMRGAVRSRKAFMAMSFDSELDWLFLDHFRPAVRKTGFALLRLDKEQKAGLIDDRIRVEIRTSRFVVADLSRHNNGAYWEAGFAEGLAKPVFYTCEASDFEDRHFDTDHLLTIKWTREEIDRACEDLKAAIRNSLPDEARMTD